MKDIALVLQTHGRGEGRAAAEELLPLVYEKLRQLAAQRLARDAAGHAYQPSSLVHEVWLRLVKNRKQDWRDQSYFFAAAAEAMRRILIEDARQRARLKNGAGQPLLNIEELEVAQPSPEEKLLLVDEALEELQQELPEIGRVVMLKFFSGLTNQEIAQALDISQSTVDRHWFRARRWLYRKLQLSCDPLMG